MQSQIIELSSPKADRKVDLSAAAADRADSKAGDSSANASASDLGLGGLGGLDLRADSDDIDVTLALLDYDEDDTKSVIASPYALKSSVYVFCSDCGVLRPAKFRVRCAKCKSTGFVLRSEPNSLSDLLTPNRLRGQCSGACASEKVR